jgi:hypothetical protein
VKFRSSSLATILALGLLAATSAQAEIGIGGDLVSRYVWRGSDFGDGVSVQPYISYTSGGLEIGTWASYPISAAAGANEHDLYVTYSVMEALSITLTDYYFPQGGMFLEFGDEDGAHSLEISASYDNGPLSVMAGFFFLNDVVEEDALYVEVGYDLGQVSDGISAGLFGAVGNGQYSNPTDSAIKFVNLGLTLSNGDFSASYIVNPEAETTFLVLGKSL